MANESMFHGIAIVIDDEVNRDDSNIKAIQKQIENEGCHVVGLEAIPTQKQIENLKSAAFFIVDWNLYATISEDGKNVDAVEMPAGLRKQHIAEIITFLKDIRKTRFAPVFIFTNEPVEGVREELKKHPELFNLDDPSHIVVLEKDQVIAKGVFTVLLDWLASAPSAYVLKKWENEYEAAKNTLFLDFYNKSVIWPLVLWQNFADDGVAPSIELGNVISRNLMSRMTPFEFDLEPFDKQFKSAMGEPAKYRAILLKVLEGERFLLNERIHTDSISPGDVFKDGQSYYVNLRPDCDCVPRKGLTQDDVELYLLKGSKLSGGQLTKAYNPAYGTLNEKDSEFSIFAMYDGRSFSFQFQELILKRWGDWSAKRIGRLLPPYVTRLQQRYSTYLQRPGVNRIPSGAVADAAGAAQATA
jgi:hypothetical protein